MISNFNPITYAPGKESYGQINDYTVSRNF